MKRLGAVAVLGGVSSLVVLAAFLLAPRFRGDGDRQGDRLPLRPAGDIRGQWELESGVLDGAPIPIVDGYRITLTVDGGEFGGRSACNYYGASVARNGASLTVGEVAGTLIGCEGAVDASESAYLAALRRIRTVATDGQRLVLAGPGLELRFRPLTPLDPRAVLDREWLLEGLVEHDAVLGPLGPPAVLELRSDGSFSGSTGCRTFVGRYVIAGDEIGISAMDMLGDANCGHALVAQENHILSVIGEGPTRVEDGSLILTGRGNVGLIYRSNAAEPAAEPS